MDRQTYRQTDRLTLNVWMVSRKVRRLHCRFAHWNLAIANAGPAATAVSVPAPPAAAADPADDVDNKRMARSCDCGRRPRVPAAS